MAVTAGITSEVLHSSARSIAYYDLSHTVINSGTSTTSNKKGLVKLVLFPIISVNNKDCCKAELQLLTIEIK